jgi:hypothetical protein
VLIIKLLRPGFNTKDVKNGYGCDLFSLTWLAVFIAACFAERGTK